MTATIKRQAGSPTHRRETKRNILSLLGRPDLTEIFPELLSLEDRDLIGPLFSALCHTDLLVRWHAVSAFGPVVCRMAERDLESARIVMRRFLWSLNDESGGIGWGAPEAMAEIMSRSAVLAGEYLHMLVSYILEDGPEAFQDGNFIELPMLQRGVLWGIARLMPCYRQTLERLGVAADLRPYLLSPDGDVRGLACRCLHLLGEGPTAAEVAKLGQDSHQLVIYSGEGFISCTVAEIVRRWQAGGQPLAAPVGSPGTCGRCDMEGA